MGAGFMVTMIQRGAVSLSRVNEILKTVPSIRDSDEQELQASPNEQCLHEGIPALELINLDFSYGAPLSFDNETSSNVKEGSQTEAKKILEGINLKINRGQWLGIMGKTGSGKSTLIKTFMRMIDPPDGGVRVFGLDVKKWQLEDLRKLFAVSPQDSYLFSDLIMNNIAYGLSSDDSRRKSLIERAIDFAALRKDLGFFQNGKETLVGERGLTLSGGQKQRTAIARAAIMDSEFLILDDSLSAVDNETEIKILDALWKERKGRTTIIISHRVSTLKYADNILVLDKGKAIEYGSPAQLISAGGFYSRMASFQKLESGAFGEV